MTFTSVDCKNTQIEILIVSAGEIQEARKLLDKKCRLM